LSDLPSALSRFGQSAANLGLLIDNVEAENEERNARLQIADEVEKFKESLWQDPDYGTPGQEGGYTKKWTEFLQGTKERAGLNSSVLGSIRNPKAQKNVTSYLEQVGITQGAEVKALQFTRWKEGTVAQAGRRVSELLDKGMPAQAKLDAAAEEYGALRNRNLIDQETYLSDLESASQVAIRKDLVARAKAAYRTGDLAAAENLIAGDSATYSAAGQTFNAGDKVKDTALQDLRLFADNVQSQADAKMQDSWANYVAQSSGRALPNPEAPQFSLSLIQGYKTPDGFEMDAKHKEYWTNRLLSFDNGAKTGAGSLDSATANLFLGQAQKMTDALREVKGGIRPASATIRLWNPKSNEYSTVPISEDSLRAFMRSDDFTQAMDAGGVEAWNKAGGLTQELGKPLGSWDTVLKNTVEPALKKIPDPSLAAQLRAEYEAGWKAHADWGPDQIGKYAQTDILGKAYKIQIADSLNFQPGKYDNLDTFTTDSWDGRFKNAVIDGAITNPLYKPTLDQNAARIQKGLEPIVGPTTIMLDDKGHPWFKGQPKKAGSLPTQREGKSLGTPEAINYTLAPLAEGTKRNAQVLRDIIYPYGAHVLQMNVNAGDASEWVDVFLVPGGDKFQMSPADMSRILKARETKKQGQVDTLGNNTLDPYTEYLMGRSQ
jgi:hypothetical protein